MKLGADAYACSNVNATAAATLGAGSFVSGGLETTTSTVAAGGFVLGLIEGTTATLGANACYGNISASTITRGAGAGQCGDRANGVNTDTSRADSVDSTVNLCPASGT